MILEFQAHVPRRPRNGHHFQDGGEMIMAESFQGLLDKIAIHRAQNALPMGNIEQEVLAYYKEVAPFLVKERDQPEPINGAVRMTAENIMAVWYGKMRTGIADDTKLGICGMCPMKCWIATDSHYWNEAERRASLMLGDMDPFRNGVCAHHLMPIQLFASMERPELIATEGAPDNCWISNEYKTG